MPVRFKVLIAALLGLSLAACGGRASGSPDPRPWDEVLRNEGLSAAETHLASQDETPETAFLLGAVRFLRAGEHVMQVRYKNYAGELPLLPGMRNTLPEVNPDGRFDPAFLERAMSGALVHLEGAEAALAPAVEGEFAVEVQLADIWLDINSDGARQEWEGALAIMSTLGAAPASADFEGVVRFDTADAEWLAAYVHVIAGMAELTLSLDPTPAIERVTEGRAGLEAIGGVQPDFFSGRDDLPDMIAATLLTLRGTPDAERTRAAHGHFLSMIAHNRAFWSEVGEERDNNREWLPNAQQSSAFGVEVSAEMAAGWQGVLMEIEQILNGERLVPYWRVGRPDVGLNIEKLLREPGDMDLILWIQGSAAVPYLEEGEVADLESWERFTRMTRGDGLMFAVWFN